jgi:hypothetical protein
MTKTTQNFKTICASYNLFLLVELENGQYDSPLMRSITYRYMHYFLAFMIEWPWRRETQIKIFFQHSILLLVLQAILYYTGYIQTTWCTCIMEILPSFIMSASLTKILAPFSDLQYFKWDFLLKVKISGINFLGISGLKVLCSGAMSRTEFGTYTVHSIHIDSVVSLWNLAKQPKAIFMHLSLIKFLFRNMRRWI